MSAQELILDDGFCFGLGAFETIAVMYGQPVFLEPHLKRLREALDFFGIPDLSLIHICRQYPQFHAVRYL